MKLSLRWIIYLLAIAILMVKCSSSEAATAKEDSLRESRKVAKNVRPALNLLPILMYDTNIGVGYGMKLFLLNQLHRRESFDLTVFNSTKGERWYRFVGSWPDFELRQRKVYPIAVDLIVEYDKLIKASFFGIGNRSQYEDREYYTKESMQIRLAFSRGISPRVVSQVGVRFKSTYNFNFVENSRLRQTPPRSNAERVSNFSFPVTLRYDTRNSVINPSRGVVLQGEMEMAPDIPQNDVTFTRISATAQSFSVLFHPITVLALRTQVQYVSGHELPMQVLLSLGGARTMRGLPQDRFLGRTMALSNVEIRFPIYQRLGGVVGLDVGKVWDTPDVMNLQSWKWNPAAGLCYYLRTFVARLDIGFGEDELGIFLNFGHMF